MFYWFVWFISFRIFAWKWESFRLIKWRKETASDQTVFQCSVKKNECSLERLEWVKTSVFRCCYFIRLLTFMSWWALFDKVCSESNGTFFDDENLLLFVSIAISQIFLCDGVFHIINTLEINPPPSDGKRMKDLETKGRWKNIYSLSSRRIVMTGNVAARKNRSKCFRVKTNYLWEFSLKKIISKIKTSFLSKSVYRSTMHLRSKRFRRLSDIKKKSLKLNFLLVQPVG